MAKSMFRGVGHSRRLSAAKFSGMNILLLQMLQFFLVYYIQLNWPCNWTSKYKYKAKALWTEL